MRALNASFSSSSSCATPRSNASDRCSNVFGRSSSTLSLVAAAIFAISAAGCGGEEESAATFTSQVVQRNTCRVTGDQPEACFREDVTLRVRVSVIEDAFDRVWLSGITRGGELDTRILGTLDAEGGYLFANRIVNLNEETGCRLTDTIELTLRVDEEAAAEEIGVDPCVALVGREVRTSTTSAACDDINDPPVPVTRIVRRRWERPGTCSADLDDPLDDS